MGVKAAQQGRRFARYFQAARGVTTIPPPMNSTLFQSLPDAVSVYEVSPRDGLQNEACLLYTSPSPRD